MNAYENQNLLNQDNINNMGDNMHYQQSTQKTQKTCDIKYNVSAIGHVWLLDDFSYLGYFLFWIRFCLLVYYGPIYGFFIPIGVFFLGLGVTNYICKPNTYTTTALVISLVVGLLAYIPTMLYAKKYYFKLFQCL